MILISELVGWRQPQSLKNCSIDRMAVLCRELLHGSANPHSLLEDESARKLHAPCVDERPVIKTPQAISQPSLPLVIFGLFPPLDLSLLRMSHRSWRSNVAESLIRSPTTMAPLSRTVPTLVGVTFSCSKGCLTHQDNL